MQEPQGKETAPQWKPDHMAPVYTVPEPAWLELSQIWPTRNRFAWWVDSLQQAQAWVARQPKDGRIYKLWLRCGLPRPFLAWELRRTSDGVETRVVYCAVLGNGA